MLAKLRRGWRWWAVAATGALLGVSPILVRALPASAPDVGPAALLTRINTSATVAYQGLAESRGGLGLPDVPQARRTVDLLGGRTRLRAWWADPTRWRVDALTPIAEQDTYRDKTGVWIWDSDDRSATRVNGNQDVRLVRAADLLPPELGRRLAAAATPNELSPLPAASIAGVDAQGLRIEPHSRATTIERVDLWADPRTGLPLRVEVTARGLDRPIVTSAFLDLSMSHPGSSVTNFTVPQEATISVREAPDFAQEVDHFSPYVLPDSIGGAARRSAPARAAGTYGTGFGLVATLALPERYTPSFDKLPIIQRSWGTASVAQTPILNGLIFTEDGVTYMLGGTVPLPRLEHLAASLARHGAHTG